MALCGSGGWTRADTETSMSWQRLSGVTGQSFPTRFSSPCSPRRLSTWLSPEHSLRISPSKTSKQDFLLTGPNRSGFWGFCKGFKRVIGYTVGWRAFFVAAPLKAARLPPALLFLRGHTTIAKKVGIYLRKIPAIFIYNSLMYNDKVPYFSVVDYGIIRWISLRNKTQIRVCFCKVLFSKCLCCVIILVSSTPDKRRI